MKFMKFFFSFFPLCCRHILVTVLHKLSSQSVTAKSWSLKIMLHKITIIINLSEIEKIEHNYTSIQMFISASGFTP